MHPRVNPRSMGQNIRATPLGSGLFLPNPAPPSPPQSISRFFYSSNPPPGRRRPGGEENGGTRGRESSLRRTLPLRTPAATPPLPRIVVLVFLRVRLASSAETSMSWGDSVWSWPRACPWTPATALGALLRASWFHAIGEDVLAVVAPSADAVVYRNCLCKFLRAKTTPERMATAQPRSVTLFW